ncbi:hypothetical protein HBH56_123340 [Parastagonospora nodorum]|uniref:Chitin-binding type-4 domain-containing protein n=2 Tax=Phaeosphaeria nodorum (strain SN15 / ATCC MYA-4574 / FGSC 10173) TaxID=321614 RepID=A0A7U2EQW1_PHANO|nr:hypothetical protein SNOG_00622 [Parastagonospora nodorum SN15]KAH3912229.1 hypothetical protein HBH56_123340 [Parastagonospora nodorum]EAT92117.1 hypothetical protein SNOG_00622 [Parastagonospora nodorum SN15]KAH3934849.1 hypothetical protein HBH54_048880 [Parastagonospora nodorum]KAH3987711.1 hypothetical protein HBH52_039220 [Parastagonospora nodorum]KAH4041949.1 hypothetical protein HBI09_006730 [Parastagonospora nodorum]
MSIKTTILAVTALLSAANAHIKITQPVPFSKDTLDTSPVTKQNYPCKNDNGFKISTMNQMAVGTKQTLAFSGTAVHGGGSCQLSVTTDPEPNENSVFKVIKSIEGGCPGVDGATKEYDFELPASIPNGKATFAWTWSSKMSGAPELYMNCAPIEVTGGASDKTEFMTLPDMLKYNVGEGCTSAQNFATKFPNPGSVVEKGAADDQKPPTGSCGSTGSTPAEPSPPAGQPSPPAGQPSPPAGQPSSPAGQPSASAPPSQPTPPAGGQSSAAAPPSAPSPPPSNPGGVFAPGASAAPTPATSTTLVTVTGAPTPAKPTVPVGTGTPAQPTPPSTGGGSAPGGSAPAAPGGSASTCSTNGAVVCNGEKQFGLCNNGNVVWQEVASGTACVNGVISKRSMRVARPRYNRKV